jgi:endonuclease YncB( thermonuclease family)
MKILSIIISLVVLATAPTLAATLSGKVVRVADGDTITILTPNKEQVKNGAAWAYTQYLTDDRIKQAENEARASKAGLWALQADQIMPPW